MKAVLRNKKSQINNQTLHLKELEKEQHAKPKMNRRKEIIKTRAEINEIESEKQYKRSMNQEPVLWEKKPQDWQTFNQTHQEKIEDPNKIRIEREETTDSEEATKDCKKTLWTTICQQIGKSEQKG